MLSAIILAGALLPSAPITASADTTPSLGQLNSQLDAATAKLNDLNNQVEVAQASVNQLNQKVAADQQKEAALNQQLMQLGRLEYEQPAFSLTTVLEATSLQQLLTNIAQSRLIATKQSRLLGEAHQLRTLDQQAHDQMAAQLAHVQAARDDAAKVAAQALALRNSANAALAAKATAVVSMATSTGSGSVGNHFAFGYCTWWVASKRPIPWFGNAAQWWPNARAYGFAEGQTPKVGAVMVTSESSVGHVAFVESVSGSSWTVSEMNYTAWDVVDHRTLGPGFGYLIGFIY